MKCVYFLTLTKMTRWSVCVWLRWRGGCVWCHFAGPSALTWNRALPLPESYQFLEEIPAAGKHDPSTPRPSALSSLCPGACLGLNPRISSTTALTLTSKTHLCTRPPIYNHVFRQPVRPRNQPPSMLFFMHHWGNLYPSSSAIPSSLCLKFNLIYISPGVTKYPHYQLRCLPALFCIVTQVIYSGETEYKCHMSQETPGICDKSLLH